MEIFYLIGVGLIAYAIYYYLGHRDKEPYLFDMKARVKLKRKCLYISILGVIFIVLNGIIKGLK